MVENSSKNSNSSFGPFVKFINFFKKHRRMLLPLAAAVILGAVAAYVAYTPDASPKELDDNSMSPSRQILVLVRDLLRRNQPKEAVEVLKNYLTVHRQDQNVRLRLAELYLRLGDVDSCDATLTEALAITPNYAEAIWMQGMAVLRRGNNPAELFRQAAQTPDAPADVLGNFGLYLLSENQVEQGREYLQRAADGQTGNGRVYAELGKIAFGQNKIDEAYRLLKRATQRSPRNVEAWAVLAEVQKNRNEPDQALASLRKALDAAAGAQRGMVLMELGKAYMAQRNWTEAAEMFAQAADYPFVRAEAAFRAARCYYFTDAYAKAMHYIDQASAAAPNEPAVNEWKQKIENARYGPSATPKQPAPSLLTVPTEAKTQNQTVEKE